MNVFVTTQMRTGSTWLCDLLSGVLRTSWVFWEKGRNIKTERFKDQIKENSNKGMHLYKMHYTHPKTICDAIPENDNNTKVISITRDLRDVAVSKIMYMRYDKPMRNIARLKSVNEDRMNFGRENVSDKRYINLFINHKSFNKIINNWKMYNDGFSHPNYLLITYEELHSRRLFTIKKICDFLNVYRNNKGLRRIILKNNFQAKTGRKHGQEINSSFRRKGIIGDHKNYINGKNIKKLTEIMEECIGKS